MEVVAAVSVAVLLVLAQGLLLPDPLLLGLRPLGPLLLGLPRAEVEDPQPEGVLLELRPLARLLVAAEVVAGRHRLLFLLLLLLTLVRRRPLGRRCRRLSSAERTRRCRGGVGVAGRRDDEVRFSGFGAAGLETV